MTELFDVVEVEIAEPNRKRVMDTGKTKENAEAYIYMAVARRGVERSFYTAVPAGTVADNWPTYPD